MRRFLAYLSVLIGLGCVKLPTVVMIDRRTALQQQLELNPGLIHQKVLNKTLSDRPAPFTQKELISLGVFSNQADLYRLLTPYRGYTTDQQRIDTLLKQHCVGEGEDGFLILTPELCTQQIDRVAVTRLIQRINAQRRGVLKALMDQWKVDAKEASRRFHKGILQLLVCGGLYEEGGKWKVKQCR